VVVAQQQPGTRFTKSMQEGIGDEIDNDDDGESLVLDTLGEAMVLPPVMCAPPSSPASVTLFTLFRVTSGRFPGQAAQQQADSFAPFMLENTLVTPPIFSASTTTPPTPLSTAPFTPPPELAHLTTPSSPEVPFAHLLAPSFESKCSLSNPIATNADKGFPTSGLELFYQLYPYSSCMARVASSRSGDSSSGTASPFPEKLLLENDDGGDAAAKEMWHNQNVAFGGFLPKLIVDETAAMELEQHVVEPRLGGLGLGKDAEGRRQSCYELVQNAEHHRVPRKLMSDQTAGITTRSEGRSSSLDAFGLGGAASIDAGGEKSFVAGEAEEGMCCCSKCSELARACRDLSEALEKAKEKLMMLEKRVDVLDDKERKLQQLIQWIQLGVSINILLSPAERAIHLQSLWFLYKTYRNQRLLMCVCVCVCVV
jgi:hypothetical protein